MSNTLVYDEESDTLLLRRKNAKVETSLNDGTDVCILELDKNKNVVGLEFLDVHRTFGIPLEVLKNLKKSKVNIRYEKSKKTLFVRVTLYYKQEKENINIPFTADVKGDFKSRNFMACASG